MPMPDDTSTVVVTLRGKLTLVGDKRLIFHKKKKTMDYTYTSSCIDQPAHRSSLLRLGSWEAGWQNFCDSDVLLAVGYNSLVSSYGPSNGLQGD